MWIISSWPLRWKDVQIVLPLFAHFSSEICSKNEGRVGWAVGNLPQGWGGGWQGHHLYHHLPGRYQDQAWDCVAHTRFIYFNFLILATSSGQPGCWSSTPPPPWRQSECSPQPTSSCSPGFLGWGSHQCSAGSPPSSPTPSLSATCFWEAPSDDCGEADIRYPQCGRPLISPTSTTPTFVCLWYLWWKVSSTRCPWSSQGLDGVLHLLSPNAHSQRPYTTLSLLEKIQTSLVRITINVPVWLL